MRGQEPRNVAWGGCGCRAAGEVGAVSCPSSPTATEPVGRDGLLYTQSRSAPNLSAAEPVLRQGGSGQTSSNQEGGRGARSPPPTTEAVGGPSTQQLEAPGLKRVKSPESLLLSRLFGHYQTIF